MEADDLKQAWGSPSAQGRLTIDEGLLLKEVQRSQKLFAALLFWRDAREVGIALVLVPLWVYLGRKGSLPWTWYLIIAPLVWIAGFMLVDNMRQKRYAPVAGESLRRRIESSLAQVEHQMWLLRSVFWWALLPMGIPMFAFLGQATWQDLLLGWPTVLLLALLVIPIVVVFGAVYWLNQIAIRTELQPRREELVALLASLGKEAAGGNGVGGPALG